MSGVLPPSNPPAGLSPLHRDVCGKRASKAVIAMRVQELAQWISQGASRATLIRRALEEWGVGPDTYDQLHKQATAVIRQRLDIERPDYLAEKLAHAEYVFEQACADRCWPAAVGALSLMGKWVGAGFAPKRHI
ncbi:hypothetical protein VB734_13635 [Synechococcus sp. BA-124 BA4]|uniref:hypothetical protein n=1 Tax=Synechococcus sp. BA-124 BA4 TaxID=3110251 RepID=UPI002B21CE56|nr:hypothetical protein [Synechococcus sp. BA-124 BA4]MEA5401078.1 hypothetical protein [Synechococcus sp. BA-124 BA4]